MNSIEICGVLVHVKPDRADAVSAKLGAMPGVEVHGVSPAGQMVITIEELDGRPLTTETLKSFNDVDGVLSTSLIYQHSEPADEEAA